MSTEENNVRYSLKKLFNSASDIFVDSDTKVCEVKISVDEFQGELREVLIDSGIRFQMVDFWDNYPFKYVFQYHTK
jgi:hypothetical protein